MKKWSFLFCLVISMTQAIIAQTNLFSKYDHHEAFSPISNLPEIGAPNSSNGAPGEKYWQNRADYKIEVSLDTLKNIIEGTVNIIYKNNSPDKLDFLWLELEQNIFKQDSRAKQTSSPEDGLFSNGNFNGGYAIQSVSLFEKGRSIKAEFSIIDTRMQIKLKNPLENNRGIIDIKLKYSFEIPENRAIRNGRLKTSNGWIYQVAQWYPRMCVYDDMQGWNILPYLGAGEFYLEYGDFDYSITLPSNMVVVASGELKNPEMVLTSVEINRLNRAKRSDTTIMIHDVADALDPEFRSKKGMFTWQFSMKNTRDVSWAASSAFVWDAARINLPSGKKALAQSVYPIESAGKNNWGRSTEFVKGIIEYNTVKWYEYPYPNAINVAGKLNGMEYPGIVFTNINLKGSDLFNITNHEFGHYIFPIMVGSNERKYAWMDEGLNTFMNILSAENFNNGEFRLPAEMFNLHEAAKYVFGEKSEAIMTLPDVMQRDNLSMIEYGKTAVALHLLRTKVLGEQRFDYAFKKFIQYWAFKHPSPADFFRTIENASGEDLGWFWKGWFLNNWKLDQGVKSIEYINNDFSRGSKITIENLDKMVMPVVIEIKETSGVRQRITLPVEIWQRGGIWTFNHPSSTPIESVTIDPDSIFPDINTANNTYKLLQK